MQLKYYKFIFYVLLIIFSISCNNKKRDTKKKLIVTTTNILGDSIKNIVAGDSTVEVVSIMGIGVDPHLYKPTKKDIDLILKADIVFYNGLHLEGKMSDILSKLSKERKIFGLGDLLDKGKLIVISDNLYDPHIWFDIPLWIEANKLAYNILVKESIISKNNGISYESYINQLNELHIETQSKFKAVDSTKRILVTAHDAFSYFGRTYGIEVNALQGISTMSEFGIKDINNLVDYIIYKKVKTIFAETSISNKSLMAVLNECNSRSYNITLEEGLFSDSLGSEEQGGDTYIKMINSNTDKIVNGIN